MMRSSFANVVTGDHIVSGDSGSHAHNEMHNEDFHSENHEHEVENEVVYNCMAIDSNLHPLYLHNNDHPGLILIAKKLIGPDNYAPWSRSMRIALNARNKFVLVNGTYAKPDISSPLFAQWERVNDLVITWILNSVAEDISDGLNYVTTASEVWIELRERFSGVNGHRVYQVLKDIHSLEQGNRSVEVYFHKLKALWDEYLVLEPTITCVCGSHKKQVEREQKRKLLQFLMGLHDSNANIRGQILLMDPMPTLSQAYAFVKQDEKARQGFNSSIPAAPVVASINAATVGNFSTGQKKQLSGANKSTLKCSYCNFTGHTREQCYKLIGYPPNWKKKKDSPGASSVSGQFRSLPNPTNGSSPGATAALTHNVSNNPSNDQLVQMQHQLNQMNQMMSFLMNTGKTSNSPEDHLAGMVTSTVNSVATPYCLYTWLIDTGATDHMCCSLAMLTDVVTLPRPITLSLPNGAVISVTQSGTFRIHPTLVLHNVFYVPSFTYNLLSVSKWIKDTGGYVSFYVAHCEFRHDKSDSALGFGRLIAGLFHLEFQSLNVHSPVVNSVTSKTKLSALWHLRLGHVSNDVLHHIPDISSTVVSDCNKQCPICPISKQTKLPFPVSSSRATLPFDLIHVDLWGPYASETHNGCRYFLTIVDDHTRNVWTFLLPSKQHVFSQLKQFFEHVHTQFGVNIKVIRSDNGTEFFNATLNAFLADKGVMHQASCVGTPAQNGRVERRHRQILAIARSLRFQSGLPIKFWGECILTATFIINRVPSPVLDNKTPFECLYHSLPDYSVFKVFGCLCYASVHDSNKFDPRAIRSVFVGYPYGCKGYKLLNLATKQIFVSRHVIFHEQTFPFLNDTHSTVNTDPHQLQHWLSDIDDSSSPVLPSQSVPNVLPVPDVVPTPNVSTTSPTASSHVDDDWTTLPPDNDTLVSLHPDDDLPSFSADHFLRKSTRERHHPAWWNDYKCNSIVKYLLANFVSSHAYSPDHQAFMVQLHKAVEPKSFAKAVLDPKWVDAMNKELTALESNNTWILVPLPAGKQTIGCRWVFKIKYHANGEIDRYKARLVAKGYTQEPGVDFHDTFAPVAKGVTVKAVMALASSKNWPLFQLDINNAFLHGDLVEEVYMDVPPGYKLTPSTAHFVCRLIKSIYGLR